MITQRGLQPPGRTSRALQVGLAGLALIGLAACGGGEEEGGTGGEELRIVIGDSAASTDNCRETGYTGEAFVGTRLTLRDSDNKILDTDVVEGDGTRADTVDRDQGATQGCVWNVPLSGVGNSPAYQLEIESPGGGV